MQLEALRSYITQINKSSTATSKPQTFFLIRYVSPLGKIIPTICIIKQPYNFLQPFLVLLLQGYNAKLSNFGLAKDGPTDEGSHVVTKLKGTYGYAAPEYIATG